MMNVNRPVNTEMARRLFVAVATGLCASSDIVYDRIDPIYIRKIYTMIHANQQKICLGRTNRIRRCLALFAEGAGNREKSQLRVCNLHAWDDVSI